MMPPLLSYDSLSFRFSLQSVLFMLQISSVLPGIQRIFGFFETDPCFLVAVFSEKAFGGHSQLRFCNLDV